MKFNFSSEVEKAFEEAGWSPERCIDPMQLLRGTELFTPSSRVMDILSSVGNLTVKPIRDGTQVLANPELLFYPISFTSEANIREVEALVGGCFFPIAENGVDCLLLDDRDRVFLYDYGYLALIGNSFEGGVETIICGRRYPDVIQNV